MQRKNKPQVLAIRTQASPPEDQEQESEGFIAPTGKGRKNKKDLRQFFQQNQYVYKPQESQGQRIRYVPQGSMPTHLMKVEEIRKMQKEQFFHK